jgi:hypothetical protein
MDTSSAGNQGYLSIYCMNAPGQSSAMWTGRVAGMGSAHKHILQVACPVFIACWVCIYEYDFSGCTIQQTYACVDQPLTNNTSRHRQ